jgi:pimeloyl-ACP methyl ester carboxylesterase
LISSDHLYKTPQGYAEYFKWYDATLAALNLPYQSHMIDTLHGRTHVLELGDRSKPPMIMLQGFGASAPLWKKQFADFARDYHLFAFDIPGHPGKSEPRVLSLLDTSYIDWLTQATDAVGVARAPVVGVCLGGWIAMQYAAKKPERVDKLVLLSPVGLAPFKIFVRSGIPLVLNFGRERDDAGRRLLRMAFTPPGSGLQFDRDVAKALMIVIKHYDIAAIAGIDGARPTLQDFSKGFRTLGKFVRAEPDTTLRRISAPTLLLVGEHEAIYNPYAALRRARRTIPNLDAEIVAGTGHATIYDKPEVVNPRVLAFLEAPHGAGR